MPLIKCPKCGEMISDKAAKCVHCGFILNKEVKNTCKECGSPLQDGAKFCNYCGCPVNDESSSKTEEIPTINENLIIGSINENKIKSNTNDLNRDNKINSFLKTIRSNKKILIVVCAVAVLICFGLVYSSNQKASQKDCYYKLVLINSTIDNKAFFALTDGQYIISVAKNTNFEKYDSTTDDYTINSKTKHFYSGSDQSLKAMYKSANFSKLVKGIVQDKKDIQDDLTSLPKMPNNLEAAYKDLKAYYDKYSELVDLIAKSETDIEVFAKQYKVLKSELQTCDSKMDVYFK